MKRFFSALLFFSASLYGQDAYTGASVATGIKKVLTRDVLVYIYGSSGNINNLAAPVFSGNETELGLRYSQNFERAPWLTVGIQADFSVGMGWEHQSDNTPIPSSGSVSLAGFAPALRFMVHFTPYFQVEMNTEGQVELLALYTYIWNRHQFSLLGQAELDYLSFGGSEYTFGTAYEYRIYDWVLGAALGLRFGNDVVSSLHLRLEGLLAYKLFNSTLWGRIRYEPRGIAIAGGIQHQVILQAGFNYQFTFLSADK